MRKCRFCDRALVRQPKMERIDTEGTEHCPSPNCHWCIACQTAKWPAKK